MAALPLKTVLQNGAFVVGPMIGQGGFGITYKGGDVALRRVVAIKEFFPQGSGREGTRLLPAQAQATLHADSTRGFLDEARTLARFNHPAIARVYRVFEENNTAYMVMEFLEGQTLAQLLDARGGRLPEQEVLEIARQVAEALGEVHGAGILHRDIKPENIIVHDGRAVLIDFGTARLLSAGTQRMTQLVTPGYAPLEQYAAQAKRTPATDVYALAATLYHLLSGVAPVAATDRVLEVALPDIRLQAPHVSPSTGVAIMRALEMDIGSRPQSASEFLAELQGGTPGFSLVPSISPAPGVAPTSVTPTSAPSSNQGAVPVLALTMHQKLSRHASSVNALAFTPEGILLSAGQDKIVNLWNPKMRASIGQLTGHALGILALAVSPDGGWLASGSLDTTIRLWDIKTRQSLAVLSGHSQPVQALAFSPSERLLVSGGEEGIWQWDMSNGYLLGQLPGSAGALAFTPDGSALAATSEEAGVVIWDTRSWSILRALPPQFGKVKSVAFSPDGSALLTGGMDGVARIWDFQDGRLLATLQGHNGSVHATAFSPDGMLVATGGEDFSVRVWSARDGAFLRRHTRHHDRVTSVAFLPDRSLPGAGILASGSRDKSINTCRCAFGGETYWEKAQSENA